MKSLTNPNPLKHTATTLATITAATIYTRATNMDASTNTTVVPI